MAKASEQPRMNSEKRKKIVELVDAILANGSEAEIQRLRDYADNPDTATAESMIITQRLLLDHAIGSGGNQSNYTKGPKTSEGRQTPPKPTLDQLDQIQR